MILDFDKMQQLYKDNPEEFAAFARDQIYDYIYSVPDTIRQEQLMDLQHKIDRELSHYKDPIARMNKMVELFWVQVQLLNDALNTVPVKSPLVDNIPTPVPSTAKIIQFPKKT